LRRWGEGRWGSRPAPVQDGNGGDHFQSLDHKASIDAWTAGGAGSPQEVWEGKNWEYIPNSLRADT
jgi:hypothetical protein